MKLKNPQVQQSARKEKRSDYQLPDSPIHESVSTMGSEAVGQAQKPHDTEHITSCTGRKARKLHARTQEASAVLPA